MVNAGGCATTRDGAGLRAFRAGNGNRSFQLPKLGTRSRGCSANPMWSSWSLSPIVKATPDVIKEITNPVPVLSKCPDPPATLKKKFLSLSFDPGRCTRKREKTEKQKAETSANEHP